MLQKAFQAREHYRERHEVVLAEAQPDEELAIFGGQTRLISPEKVFGSSAPSTPPLQLKPNFNEHTPLDSQLVKNSDEAQRMNVPDGYLDNLQATFADLTGGWDGLFHEVPQPCHGNFGVQYPAHESGEGAMLDDRWSSFMHNYSILAQPTQVQYPSRFPNS